MRRMGHERADLGDFQTPRDLVDAVLKTLGPIASRWSRVLEPTCGRGSFLQALLEHDAPPRELIGIEIQETYATMARFAGRQACRLEAPGPPCQSFRPRPGERFTLARTGSFAGRR